MICPSCNANLPDGTSVCILCGTILPQQTAPQITVPRQQPQNNYGAGTQSGGYAQPQNNFGGGTQPGGYAQPQNNFGAGTQPGGYTQQRSNFVSGIQPGGYAQPQNNYGTGVQPGGYTQTNQQQQPPYTPPPNNVAPRQKSGKGIALAVGIIGGCVLLAGGGIAAAVFSKGEEEPTAELAVSDSDSDSSGDTNENDPKPVNPSGEDSADATTPSTEPPQHHVSAMRNSESFLKGIRTGMSSATVYTVMSAVHPDCSYEGVFTYEGEGTIECFSAKNGGILDQPQPCIIYLYYDTNDSLYEVEIEFGKLFEKMNAEEYSVNVEFEYEYGASTSADYLLCKKTLDSFYDDGIDISDTYEPEDYVSTSYAWYSDKEDFVVLKNIEGEDGDAGKNYFVAKYIARDILDDDDAETEDAQSDPFADDSSGEDM